MNPRPSFFSLFHRTPAQIIFIGLSGLLVCFNLYQLHKQISDKIAERKRTPYIFLGFKFAGLNAVLGNNGRIGYLTDKNMDERVNAMEFAQAEFMLVPLTLDLNNPDHEYVILSCSSPEETWKKVRDLGLVPLKQNRFGVMLARNPKVRQP